MQLPEQLRDAHPPEPRGASAGGNPRGAQLRGPTQKARGRGEERVEREPRPGTREERP